MNKFSCLLTVAVLFTAIAMRADDDKELEHECTSWMVFNDLTGNNTNILHKNRDATRRNVSVLLSPENSPRRWIALGSNSVNSGINRSGLAGVMNSGEMCADHSMDPGKKSTPALLREILSNCDTAEQAAKMLEKFIKAGDYYHQKKGSIFFFMDPREGYICEVTPKAFTAQVYRSGYTVRANIWQNPGMQFHSRNTIQRHFDSSARAYIAFSGLNQMLAKTGRITVADIFELSRHHKMPKTSPLKRSVCFKHTNSGSSLEIDRQYPDVLSTGYFTVGHPRHTVYIPVPVCAEKLLPGMTNFQWSSASFKRFDAKGLAAPLPEEWLKFEKDSMAEYTGAREKARRLLDAGKRTEAVKLLNDTAYKIWCSAEKLLNI